MDKHSIITPILLLSGHDPTGGAGMVADSKTAFYFDTLPLTIPSALTEQNSSSFHGFNFTNPDYIRAVWATLSKEFSPNTLKMGLCPYYDSEWLKKLKPLFSSFQNIIIDPVFKASSSYVSPTPSQTLFSLSEKKRIICTPNLNELKILCKCANIDIHLSAKEMGIEFSTKTGWQLVVTFEEKIGQVLIIEKTNCKEILIDLIPLSKPVHGTGCHFSTAIACGIANKKSLESSVNDAIRYMNKKIHNRKSSTNLKQDFLF